MPESSRVEREREFHNSLVTDGSPTIATREWWQSPGGLVRFRRRIELLRTELRRYDAPRVLVVGCGDGEWVNEISRFAKVLGIDISDRIIARATSALRDSKRAEVEVGDAHNLRFTDGTFDVCFANSTLHHLDLSTALPEIYRVLRSGGCLVAGEPNRSNPLVWLMYSSPKRRTKHGLTPDEQAFTRHAIIRQLRRSFVDIDVKYFDFWHPALGAIKTSSLRYRITLALERIPVIKRLSGSLWIVARRQS